MLLSNYADVRCTYRNKKDYEHLEYITFKNNGIVQIRIEDLAPGCESEVEILCDFCAKEGRINVFPRKYSRYIQSRKVIEIDSCYECGKKKIQMVHMKRYNVSNPSQIESVRRNRSEMNRFSNKELASRLSKKELTFVSSFSESDKNYVQYTCDTHIEAGIFTIPVSRLKNIKGCPKCAKDRNKGATHHSWKGGCKELYNFLRDANIEWKAQSLEKYGNRCVLTQTKDNLHIHHLYPFSKIVKIVFEELKMPIFQHRGDYSEDEIKLILQKFFEVQARFPLGIPIKNELHNEFHKIYGKDKATPEDFKDYVFRYHQKQIEFKDSNFLSGIQNFHDYKQNATSKYTGVVYTQGRYVVSFKHKGDTVRVGSFGYEVDAAIAYNESVIKYRGPLAKLNRINPKDIELRDLDIKQRKHERMYHYPKTNSSSRFHGVFKIKGKVGIYYGFKLEIDKIPYIASYSYELVAAYQYNLLAKKLLGKEAKLNFLTEEETAFAVEKSTYFDHRKEAETIYSCIKFSDGKWWCRFTHNKESHYVGKFETDLEAAIVYNKYIKKSGLDRKLNKITEVDEHLFQKEKTMEFDQSIYFKHKDREKFATIYSCMRPRYGRWQAEFVHEGKYHYVGLYITEKEAAYAYNEYVLNHNLNRKLNNILN